jgi:hypothetical protein
MDAAIGKRASVLFLAGASLNMPLARHSGNADDWIMRGGTHPVSRRIQSQAIKTLLAEVSCSEGFPQWTPGVLGARDGTRTTIKTRLILTA